MGRKRKHNRSLPPSVTLNHGAYYYRRNGKWFNLGRTLPEMYRNLAEYVDTSRPRTVAELVAKYRLEVLPGKSEHTQKSEAKYLDRITLAFGMMAPGDVRPGHVAAYKRKRAQTAGSATVNNELGVIKHLFRMACEWDVLTENPAREVKKLPRSRRRRYVTDDEYRQVHMLAPPMIQVAMDLALLTGLRRADLLALTRDHLTDKGILIQPGKTAGTTGKTLLIGWTPALVSVIEFAKGLPPHVRRHIIATRHGKPYSASGFNANWQRLMRRCDAAGLERMQFKDLRAKSASDDDAQAATDRLGHASRQTTEAHYRRAPANVKPLR